MATILDAPATIDQLVDWNQGSYDDLRGVGTRVAVNEIVTSITLLGPSQEERDLLASDVRDVLNGSAIEVIHTIGGRRVEFSVTDEDEAIVTVDGDEIVRYDICDVA